MPLAHHIFCLLSPAQQIRPVSVKMLRFPAPASLQKHNVLQSPPLTICREIRPSTDHRPFAHHMPFTHHKSSTGNIPFTHHTSSTHHMPFTRHMPFTHHMPSTHHTPSTHHVPSTDHMPFTHHTSTTDHQSRVCGSPPFFIHWQNHA